MLLVDDEPAVRRAVDRVLQGFGLSVVTAADGADALALCRETETRVDVVLMDLTMPRMNGVAAARAIRAIRPDLPMILVTGYGEIPADAASLFVDVIAKPIDSKLMRRVLERVLTDGDEH